MKLQIAIISTIGFFFLLFSSIAQSNEMIVKKTPTNLANFLNSEDPVNFAKAHGIRLINGMVKVVMTVDASFSLSDFVSKYDLKDYKKRKNLVTAYVGIDNLKELCKEPSIVFIRLPFKFTEEGNQKP